ncbi:MAG: BT_3928 family protein [Mangrovibacterium sp.]
MKTFWHLARVITGLVFMFSGFIKGIDPWGSAYKFTDYFNAWGMDLLSPLAFPLGVLLSASEFIIGLALTMNVLISLVAVVSLLFMIFFTGLTLIIALYNPVTDCGCFGDAVKLTNWQTFFKNVLLLFLALIVVKYKKEFSHSKLSLVKAVFFGTTVFVFAYLTGYSYNHLPIMDFLPYKVGTNIPAAMTVPAEAPKDVYKNTFYYKNKRTGEERKFSETDYPWQDSLNWEFVSMDSKLIQKGDEPAIRNFTIETAEGEDIKDYFLLDPGFTFIFVVYNQEKADSSGFPAVREIVQYANAQRISVIGLTSAAPENTEHFKTVNHLPVDFFNCDQVTLKTMIRSNPGLILLKNGVIIDKWHFNDFPSVKELENEIAYFEKQSIRAKK